MVGESVAALLVAFPTMSGGLYLQVAKGEVNANPDKTYWRNDDDW